MSASVDNAASTIKDNLDQWLFDWDVTHDELTENNRKVAELSPRERNELISKLSDDDLKNWTQEIDGMSGALTASERDDLFRNLAAGLDGKQVTRLVDAFDGSPQGREALGNAIAQHASSDAKVAFVNATKDSINGDYSATDGRDGNAETVVTLEGARQPEGRSGEIRQRSEVAQRQPIAGGDDRRPGPATHRRFLRPDGWHGHLPFLGFAEHP